MIRGDPRFEMQPRLNPKGVSSMAHSIGTDPPLERRASSLPVRVRIALSPSGTTNTFAPESSSQRLDSLWRTFVAHAMGARGGHPAGRPSAASSCSVFSAPPRAGPSRLGACTNRPCAPGTSYHTRHTCRRTSRLRAPSGASCTPDTCRSAPWASWSSPWPPR